MTEQEFIQQEQAKCHAKLLKLLKKVQQTGQATQKENELLSVNNLAYFGPPRDGIPYNCLHLTREAIALLQ